MGRFKLELFIFISYFSTIVPLTSCVFFPVGVSLLTQQYLLKIVAPYDYKFMNFPRLINQ